MKSSIKNDTIYKPDTAVSIVAGIMAVFLFGLAILSAWFVFISEPGNEIAVNLDILTFLFLALAAFLFHHSRKTSTLPSFKLSDSMITVINSKKGICQSIQLKDIEDVVTYYLTRKGISFRQLAFRKSSNHEWSIIGMGLKGSGELSERFMDDYLSHRIPVVKNIIDHDKPVIFKMLSDSSSFKTLRTDKYILKNFTENITVNKQMTVIKEKQYRFVDMQSAAMYADEITTYDKSGNIIFNLDTTEITNPEILIELIKYGISISK